MQVHTIRVSYTREKQPKDYEKAAPAVEMSAAVEDGEDHVKASMSLMTDACRTVYAALGLDIPSQVADKLGAGVTPDGGKAEAKKVDAKPKADQKKAKEPEAKKAEEKSDIPDDDSGDSKKRTPPAEGKKAEAKKAEEKSDIPDDDSGDKKGRAISDSPEDRKPADDGDIPDDDGAAEAEAKKANDGDIPDDDSDDGDGSLTHDDLFQMVQARVSGKQLTPAAVKEILAGYNVVRVSELDADKLEEVRDQIDLACQK